VPRRNDAFNLGQGIEPEQHVCSECGYAHTNRKNFRRTEDGSGYTCSTGHYESKDGQLKRAKNTYAPH
jgi:hypothetical protein